MSFDPYQILGVPSSANLDEIRRAYRGLARRYHPDLNKSSEAEDRFKLIAEAYSVLSDRTRRALFDEFGEVSLALGFDPQRFRAEAARSRSRARSRQSSPDHRADRSGHLGSKSPKSHEAAATGNASDVSSTLELDLATALRGGPVKVPTPGGAVLSVELPAGVETGHRIRLKGRGRPGVRGGPPGDLYLEVQVLPHPYFHRDGHHLVLELPVTIDEAWRGAEIEVPILDGRAKLSVPANCRGGERLRLRGKGLQGANGQRGDLIVHLCLRLPERLEAAGRSLDRLAGLYGSDVRTGLRL